MSVANPILVYGSTEFGAVVKELATACGYTFAGYIDDWKSGPQILGSLAKIQVDFSPDAYGVALAIGYKHMQARRQIADQLRDLGYRLEALIHPEAYVAPSARIDDGVLVMARASVDVRAHLGSLTVIWPGAIVSHDSVISGNSFVSPGAIICGHSRVGEACFLGAGSVVVDHVDVLPGTFLKAGEVHKGGQREAGRQS